MAMKRNIVANVVGRLWAALMSFAFVPFYIRFLGVEAYGLIGFFATMSAVFAIFDMGLSTTINRELARTDDAGELARARDLVRSLECIYWMVAGLIGIACLAGANAIAHHWLQSRTLSPATAAHAVRLMGLTAMLRWPVALYTGALTGLRRQVVLNILVMTGATLQGGGAVLVLWLVSPTIEAFFGWQLIAGAVQITGFMLLTWRFIALPGHRATFRTDVLRSVFLFSSGVFGVVLSSVILSQSDKVLLSRYLPLDQFGYYTLAAAVSAVLTTIALSVNNALFPELARLYARADGEADIADFYHLSAQIMALIVVPAGLTLCFFSQELLTLYLHNDAVVARSHALLSLWAIATTLFALMILPNSLQLASGWTSLGLYKNLLSSVVYLPVLVLLVKAYGATGGVAAWLLLVVGYVLIEPTVMHRRLLPRERGRWYLQDVGVPLAIGGAVIGGARLLAVPGLPIAVRLALATAGALAALLLSAAALPEIRHRAMTVLRQRLPALQHSA